MSDIVLQNALRKRQSICDQMDELGAELRRLEEWIAMYRQLSGDIAPTVAPEPQIKLQPEVRSRPKGADTAVDILRERHPTPVPTLDMLTRMQDRGVVIGGKNPAMNLASMLSRDPRIENIKGQGWVLVGDHRNEPAGSLFSEGENNTAPTIEQTEGAV